MIYEYRVITSRVSHRIFFIGCNKLLKKKNSSNASPTSPLTLEYGTQKSHSSSAVTVSTQYNCDLIKIYVTFGLDNNNTRM